MNLTLELLNLLVVLAVGLAVLQRLRYDVKLVETAMRYPIPSTVKSGGILDLEKLSVFIRNFDVVVQHGDGVSVGGRGHVLSLAGSGPVEITFVLRGYFDVYRVRRRVQVI